MDFLVFNHILWAVRSHTRCQNRAQSNMQNLRRVSHCASNYADWSIWVELNGERRAAPIEKSSSARQWDFFTISKKRSQLISFDVRLPETIKMLSRLSLPAEDFFSEKLQSNYLASSFGDFCDFLCVCLALTEFELSLIFFGNRKCCSVSSWAGGLLGSRVTPCKPELQGKLKRHVVCAQPRLELEKVSFISGLARSLHSTRTPCTVQPDKSLLNMSLLWTFLRFPEKTKAVEQRWKPVTLPAPRTCIHSKCQNIFKRFSFEHWIEQ